MFKILLTIFLTLPLQRLHVVDNDLTNYLTKLTSLILLIPTVTRHNDNCKTDNDCPLIMRCCEVGIKKYCCTPNNFVKMGLYQNKIIKQDIEEDVEQDIK